MNLSLTYGVVDDLDYDYAGDDNVLTKIDDFQPDTNFDDGFKDLVKDPTEYAYDW